MRFILRLFVFCALGASAGCSSTTEGRASLEHVSVDGSFAFDGAGWVRDTSTANDVWRNGNLTLFMELGDSLANDARTWIDQEKLPNVPILLDPTPMGTGNAYWYGWRSDALGGLDVYELYLIAGGHHIHVEVHGPTVSQEDARSVLSTVHTV